MCQVYDKILYHISRENSWKIGQIITAGKGENPFWSKCKDYSPTVILGEQSMLLREMLRQFQDPPFSLSDTNFRWLYEQLKDVSQEFAMYVREQTFEDIRKQYYPELPSRHCCLWLAEADTIPYWKSMDDGPRSLLELKLQGTLFCGDEYWLHTDSFSSCEYIKRAHHFWQGEMSNEPRKEFMFCGTALIKNVSHIL